MELFWKAILFCLAAVLLGLPLGNANKQWILLLILCACISVLLAAVSYWKSVLTFLRQLAQIGDIRSDYLHLILKALGIGLTAEIAGQICMDAGNNTLEKTLRVLSSAVILSLSVPMLSGLIDMIQHVLEEL